MSIFKRLIKNIDILILTIAIVVFFAVNIRMNLFSYHNFDFGKFDLGNMVQMLWNTQHGRFMYLTDYFGTNLPRWSMSHVDPILLLFLPLFILFPHPMTIVFAQILLVLLAAVLLYMLGRLYKLPRFGSLYIALAYLSYPAIGYLTARTGFHGVTAAIPFFIAAFYVYEVMFVQEQMKPKLKYLFWILLIIALTGKEQISLYVFLYGLFLLFFRVPEGAAKASFKKTAYVISVLGFVWFVVAFFVIIPAYAKYRVDGYTKFAKSLGIENSNVRDVALENYFLSRYEAFGDSYTEIIKNILLQPDLAIRVFFGGDKIDNFVKTFSPTMYLPFLSPHILVMAVPDLMMNYLTSASGIGTSEIQNHRISMIIPVLFLSIIIALKMLPKFPDRRRHIVTAIAFILLVINISMSFKYENPVFMWLRSALEKRLPSFIAFAKEDTVLAEDPELKIGGVYRLSALESKDRECAQVIVNMIPTNASVSGPDYLGAHLSMRETYAIFPALYNEADYVIVDIFSRKITTILDIEQRLVNDILNRVVEDPNYTLNALCGNLFVFKKVGMHDKTAVSPIQERFKYSEKFNYEIYDGLTLVDFTLPAEITRAEITPMQLVYLNKNRLSNYFLFLSFINEDTGYMYQVANLPSFSIKQTQDWNEDHYYVENLETVLPSHLKSGKYRVFIGMTNYVKTRSVYLGNTEVK